MRQLTVGWFGGEPLYGFEAMEDLAPFFIEIAGRIMPTIAELFQTPLADLAEDQKLHYFRMRMKDFSKDVSTKDEKIVQFQDWLDGLSDGEIAQSYQRHYNPTYLNLLSVFGEQLSAAEIHTLAIKCIKSKVWSESEHHYHLSKLLAAVRSEESGVGSEVGQDLIKLKGWDTNLIQSLLERGRGLIVCTFRFGLIRFIPTELALLGFRAAEAVNQHTFEIMESAFDSLGDVRSTVEPFEPINRSEALAAGNIRLLQTINAEDKTCTVKLVDVLKKREMIGLCIEGNTGADGPWGDTSKSVVKFFNHSIAAKNGAARLAAALGTPILPVVAVRDGEATAGRLFFSEPIIPPRRLKLSESEQFVQETMQTLYTLLESYALRYPEQWEGWSALHRWRLRDEGGANEAGRSSLNGNADGVAELLRVGKSFRINKRRVALLPTKEGVMWVDLKTLKGYQNPKWAGRENILQALSECDGLDLSWIDEHAEDPALKAKVFELLAYLEKTELVVAC
ncbi:MAG TPA: hypothetical protein VEZ40_13785 [Pyrinomonadaceae bacterium]|nr:hypothetical protein [Pyrinomonadaceae bacterium]